jgi:fructokinase
MILVSGEALVDLIPDPEVDARYDARLGGSPYNVAIGLARLGAPVGFVSNLSTDANGEALAAALAAEGVDLSLAVRDPRPTPLAFVMRGTTQTGSRYSFYLDGTAYDGAWPFPAAWPQKAKHLHLGSFSAVERHGARAIDALARARGALSSSFDPNIRPLVTPDRDALLTLVEKQAALASVVKASEEDLEWLYPGRPAEETLRHWATMGPLFCIVTRGGEGAVAWLGDERLVIPPRPVEVADTVGAGDSFMSALLFAMDRDGALGPAATRPTLDHLAAWTDFAARASAITCTRKGSQPPTCAEVEAATKA